MPHLTPYLSRERTHVVDDINSKKRVLQLLSELFSHDLPEHHDDIYDALIKREKIGSTALGRGIAIPHARISGVSTPMLAVLRLKNSIEFDAPTISPSTS